MRALPILFLLALTACRTDPPAPEASREPAPPAAEAPAAPAFEGTTEDTTVEADHTEFATLVAVRFGEQDGFERMTLEFDEEVMPGYTIAYTDQATQCGSGHPVETEGEAVLRIQVAPARAHTFVDELREPTLEDTERRLEQPILREAVQVCDHHGGVEWALGLRERAPYRVLTLDAPTRLVVDVREP